MKRGRGCPVGFVSRASPVAVTAAAPTAAVVLSSSARYGFLVPQLNALPLNFEKIAALSLQMLCLSLQKFSGELVACASGANFTPHIINIPAGEDVNMKVISFSQQGPRAICILSANGVISNVTLRQQETLGGTGTYEVCRFELLSLSGSFTPTDSGGMSVSLAAADGRVIGCGVAGLLVAASPVQVVVGSFVPSYQMDQNAKKPVIEITTVPPVATWRTRTVAASCRAHRRRRRPTPRLCVFKVENWTAPTPAAAEARRMPSSEAKVPVNGA
ncbi:hypothetical protein ABZP36_032454 [Zizania latifolia]